MISTYAFLIAIAFTSLTLPAAGIVAYHIFYYLSVRPAGNVGFFKASENLMDLVEKDPQVDKNMRFFIELYVVVGSTTIVIMSMVAGLASVWFRP